ncbi:MAG: R3H domain-containing nucleic acid-binding protein, partial [Chloroflexota bacterium]
SGSSGSGGGAAGGSGPGARGRGSSSAAAAHDARDSVEPEAPFVAGEIADRGPVERGTAPVPEPRAREARELSRQRQWRESAARAIGALKADEGTAPVNADELGELDEALTADDEALMDEALAREIATDGPAIQMEGGASLPTLRVLPQGISRKRLEQAVRELQLPVIVARDVDEADVVMTLRNEYRQKTPMIREAEERALPIYVLKTNTIAQMEASLTSIFALEVDPREAALRETEEAIGVVIERSEAVELSPQNAYIRRLQHQMAERANLVSRSRGREPYRRVRLYPDAARSAWR